MNTPALDALAALCGATSSAPAAAPTISAANHNNAAVYAMVSQQMQENRASTTAAVNQQAVSQQVTFPKVTLQALQSYLVSAGQGNQQVQATGNAYPRSVSLGHSAGFAPVQVPGGAGQLATVTSLCRPNQPDLIVQAQAIAAKILTTQQQQQRQQPHLQYTFPSIPLNRTSPAPSLAANQTSDATATAMQSHPQTASPTSRPQHSSLVETKPSKEAQSPQPPRTRPPPKKRHVRSVTTRVGSGPGGEALSSVLSEWEDKKQAKRAANRLSAHLSRKRKKMLIEDLKEENLELRRKEQILQSIPDLIVVFDSSGSMLFVSPSVSRFLDYTSQDLENSSFWDLLTIGSMQSIKSAFMDVLAVKRRQHQDSTPLCGGDLMAVELVDKNGSGKLVSLKGVVHFAGESPECVCSIRPEGNGGQRADMYLSRKSKAASPTIATKIPSLCEVSVESSRGRNRRRMTLNEDINAAPVATSHRIIDVDSVEKEI